jgi:hypothetical protein
LKYLAELAAEHLHGSYALVRTITWAVPILGFLGTVIGITMAIANVTPDQLDTSLKEVTGGLAVAFDTTALALALSMVLVFGAFVVERVEQQILAAVEEFGIKQVGCLFPDESAGGPLVQAEIQAAEQLVKKTESLIAWQTRLWQESMETLRTRWTETLDRQQSAFDKAMQEGMAATLGDHAQQLGVMRGELLKGYELVSRELAASLSKSREAQQQQQEAANRQLGDLWASVHNDICSLQSELRTQTERTVQSMTQQSEVWQVGLKEGTSAIQGQLQEMQKQGEILLCVVEQEEHLARVQELLAENIATVASADTLEETLHSLNAAVHLLTARTRPAA